MIQSPKTFRSQLPKTSRLRSQSQWQPQRWPAQLHWLPKQLLPRWRFLCFPWCARCIGRELQSHQNANTAKGAWKKRRTIRDKTDQTIWKRRPSSLWFVCGFHMECHLWQIIFELLNVAETAGLYSNSVVGISCSVNEEQGQQGAATDSVQYRTRIRSSTTHRRGIHGSWQIFLICQWIRCHGYLPWIPRRLHCELEICWSRWWA